MDSSVLVPQVWKFYTPKLSLLNNCLNVGDDAHNCTYAIHSLVQMTVKELWNFQVHKFNDLRNQVLQKQEYKSTKVYDNYTQSNIDWNWLNLTGVPTTPNKSNVYNVTSTPLPTTTIALNSTKIETLLHN